MEGSLRSHLTSMLIISVNLWFGTKILWDAKWLKSAQELLWVGELMSTMIPQTRSAPGGCALSAHFSNPDLEDHCPKYKNASRRNQALSGQDGLLRRMQSKRPALAAIQFRSPVPGLQAGRNWKKMIFAHKILTDCSSSIIKLLLLFLLISDQNLSIFILVYFLICSPTNLW